MARVDRTLEALHAIREEARATREGLDELRQEVRVTREELSDRQTRMEIRLATELVAVVGAVNQVRDAILGHEKLTGTVEDHERRLTALERRTG